MVDGAFISRPGAISMATAEMRAGLVHEDDPQMAQWPRRPMSNVLHDESKAQASAHTHTNKNTRDIRDNRGLRSPVGRHSEGGRISARSPLPSWPPQRSE